MIEEPIGFQEITSQLWPATKVKSITLTSAKSKQSISLHYIDKIYLQHFTLNSKPKGDPITLHMTG